MSTDFSVIIPAFRRAGELIEAISSVLRQRGPSTEIFVIDDSPEGSSEEAVRNLADFRVTYLKNPNEPAGVNLLRIDGHL